MTGHLSGLVCAGCGTTLPEEDPYPFRCPAARPGDDIDHVVRRVLLTGRLSWPGGDDPNPFVRYRALVHSHALALRRGMSDADYVHLVERLDKEVAAVDGHGFAETPFGRAEELSDRLGFDPKGGVWVKDETGNVSGSHKARHLMGLMVHLQVVEQAGLVDPNDRPDLAIASCGNAALAAAVVARAGDRRLRVFVPTWADPAVVERLRALGAAIEVCARAPGVAGDPTYHALQRALAEGALPFTCQGNLNGLSIEGGHTIGYELVSALSRTNTRLDRVVVQVGGGALASAVIAAFGEALSMGAVDRLPAFHAVQTRGGHPLKRAFDLVAARIDRGEASLEQAIAYAVRHRSEFMWPWEEEPRSIAEGILDDETYDWRAVVSGMLRSGGSPVVVEEDTVRKANQIGREATMIDADHTGTAGLAGLLQLRDRGEVEPGERVAVLFTGVRR